MSSKKILLIGSLFFFLFLIIASFGAEEMITNANFTSDASGWTYGENDASGVASGDWSSTGGHYDEGCYKMVHDDTSPTANPTSEQWITYDFSVTSVPSQAKLVAWYDLVTDDDTQYHAEVRLIHTNGTEFTLYASSTITGAGDTGWVEVSVDISDLIDQTGTYTVKLYVQTGPASKNAEKPTNTAYWDDVQVYLYYPEPPRWYDASVNDTEIFATETVEHRARWTDDTGLSYAVLEVNGTGTNCDTLANVSSTTLSGTQDWSNLSWTIPSACAGKVVGWRIYANDTDGSWNATDVFAYRVYEFGWLNVSVTVSPTTITQNETFWMNATVICEGSTQFARCGDVQASARYNASSSTPDTLIAVVESSPFYIMPEYRFKFNITNLDSWNWNDEVIWVNLTGFNGHLYNCSELRIEDESGNEIPYELIDGDDKSWCRIALPVTASSNQNSTFYANYSHSLVTIVSFPYFGVIMNAGWEDGVPVYEHDVAKEIPWWVIDPGITRNCERGLGVKDDSATGGIEETYVLATATQNNPSGSERPWCNITTNMSFSKGQYLKILYRVKPDDGTFDNGGIDFLDENDNYLGRCISFDGLGQQDTYQTAICQVPEGAKKIKIWQYNSNPSYGQYIFIDYIKIVNSDGTVVYSYSSHNSTTPELYLFEEETRQNKNPYPLGTLNYSNSKRIRWLINATGTGKYLVDTLFQSSYSQVADNDTADTLITILAGAVQYIREVVDYILVTPTRTTSQNLIRSLINSVTFTPAITKATSFLREVPNYVSIYSSIYKTVSIFYQVQKASYTIINTAVSSVSYLFRPIVSYVTSSAVVKATSSFFREVANYFTISHVIKAISGVVKEVVNSISISSVTKTVSSFTKYVTSILSTNFFTERVAYFVKKVVNSATLYTAIKKSLFVVYEVFKTAYVNVYHIATSSTAFIKTLANAFSTSHVVSSVSSFYKTVVNFITSNTAIKSVFGVFREVFNTISTSHIMEKASTFPKEIASVVNINSFIEKVSSFSKAIVNYITTSSYVQKALMVLYEVYKIAHVNISSVISKVLLSIRTVVNYGTITDVMSKTSAFYKQLVGQIIATPVVSKFLSTVKELVSYLNIFYALAKLSTFAKQIVNYANISHMTVPIVYYIRAVVSYMNIGHFIEVVSGVFKQVVSYFNIAYFAEKVSVFIKPKTAIVLITSVVKKVGIFAEEVVSYMNINSFITAVSGVFRSITTQINISYFITKVSYIVREAIGTVQANLLVEKVALLFQKVVSYVNINSFVITVSGAFKWISTQISVSSIVSKVSYYVEEVVGILQTNLFIEKVVVFVQKLVSYANINSFVTAVSGVFKQVVSQLNIHSIISKTSSFAKEVVNFLQISTAIKKVSSFFKVLTNIANITGVIKTAVIIFYQKYVQASVVITSAVSSLSSFVKGVVNYLAVNDVLKTTITYFRRIVSQILLYFLPSKVSSFIASVTNYFSVTGISFAQKITALLQVFPVAQVNVQGSIYKLLLFQKYVEPIPISIFGLVQRFIVITYDYTDTVLNKAYYNAVDTKPPSSLSPPGEVEFSDEAYQNISSSDDTYFVTSSSEYPYHRFNITIQEPFTSIEDITIKWEGHAGSETDEIRMYVYNYSSGSWVLFDSGSGTSDFNLTGVISSGFSDFISDSKIQILVQDPTISGCTNITASGTYVLDTDIINSSTSYCINISANDVILDCQGHTIDGDDSADYGIYVYRPFLDPDPNNITIKNCIVSDWDTANIYFKNVGFNYIINTTSISSPDSGIYIYSSPDNEIVNSTSNNNLYGIYIYSSSYNKIINLTTNNNLHGIYIYSSLNNEIINSTSSENSYYDFYITVSSDAQCNNYLDNVIGSNNLPIKYFNNTVDLSDEVLSELILCNADYSNITNITIDASPTKQNNAVLVLRTNYTNFTQVNSSNNYFGLILRFSSNNQIINSTFKNNKHDGVYLYRSSNNEIINLTASNNRQGIVFDSDCSNNTIHSSKIENNFNYGIYVISSGPNKVYNNLLNNTDNVYFANIIYENYWNTTNQSGNRVYSFGDYIGGNYWTNSTGNGFSDVCEDSDKDGFCDLAYDVLNDVACTPGVDCSNNTDYLPYSDEYVTYEIYTDYIQVIVKKKVGYTFTKNIYDGISVLVSFIKRLSMIRPQTLAFMVTSTVSKIMFLVRSVIDTINLVDIIRSVTPKFYGVFTEVAILISSLASKTALFFEEVVNQISAVLSVEKVFVSVREMVLSIDVKGYINKVYYAVADVINQILMFLSVEKTITPLWLDGFACRTEIRFNNSLTYNLTEYRLWLNVTYRNEIQPDFSDIRFVWFNSSSGQMENISYLIETKVNGEWAKVWLNLPLLPASSITKIYMFFDNKTAVVSLSNQSAVCPGGIHLDIEGNSRCWIYYEDFSTDVFTQAEWTRSSDSSVYVDTTNGWLVITEDGTNGDWALYNKTIVRLDGGQSTIYETRTKGIAYQDPTWGDWYKLARHEVLGDSIENYLSQAMHSNTSDLGWFVGGSWTGIVTPEPSDGVWSRVRTNISRSQTSLYANVNDGTALTFVATKGNKLTRDYVKGLAWYQASSLDMPVTVDWVGIRKQASPEPTYEFGRTVCKRYFAIGTIISSFVSLARGVLKQIFAFLNINHVITMTRTFVEEVINSFIVNSVIKTLYAYVKEIVNVMQANEIISLLYSYVRTFQEAIRLVIKKYIVAPVKVFYQLLPPPYAIYKVAEHFGAILFILFSIITILGGIAYGYWKSQRKIEE